MCYLMLDQASLIKKDSWASAKLWALMSDILVSYELIQTYFKLMRWVLETYFCVPFVMSRDLFFNLCEVRMLTRIRDVTI